MHSVFYTNLFNIIIQNIGQTESKKNRDFSHCIYFLVLLLITGGSIGELKERILSKIKGLNKAQFKNDVNRRPQK